MSRQTDTATSERHRHDRPHLMTIALGALDARINKIDYFDTEGGQELLRLYRRRRDQRHQRVERQGAARPGHRS